MALKVFEFEPMTREQIHDYAEASGDRNRIHLDDSFAKEAGLPSVIAHGMLSMGLAARALHHWGLPMDRLSDLDSKFKEKVFPSDRLKAELITDSSSESLRKVEFKVINQDGVEILNGSARFRL